MDMATFGIVFVGACGGSLVFIHLLEQAGMGINYEWLHLFLEITKYGSILWLLDVLYKVFF